jgi:hypothetical protein
MSNGSAAGTVLVLDIFPGSYGSKPGMLTNVNGILFFTAVTPTAGTEPWVLSPPPPSAEASALSPSLATTSFTRTSLGPLAPLRSPGTNSGHTVAAEPVPVDGYGPAGTVPASTWQEDAESDAGLALFDWLQTPSKNQARPARLNDASMMARRRWDG